MSAISRDFALCSPGPYADVSRNQLAETAGPMNKPEAEREQDGLLLLAILSNVKWVS